MAGLTDSLNRWTDDNDMETCTDASPESLSQYAHDSASRSRLRPAQSTLAFMPFTDWEPEDTDNEDPPETIRYDLNWRLFVNNRGKYMEPNATVRVSPSDFWDRVLSAGLEQAVTDFSVANSKPCKAKNTKIDLCVTKGRTKINKMVKTFKEIEVDWLSISQQLRDWSHLLLNGKTLKVEVTFHYEATNESGPGKGASRAQRAGMTVYRDAEGQSAYDLIFRHLKCDGPPCNLGPHCWEDPETKKHYKLLTHQINDLAREIEKGLVFRGHNDMPQQIREELYREAQQRADRKRKRNDPETGTNIPHNINITNVMPGGSVATALEQSNDPGVGSRRAKSRERLVTQGYWDVDVEKYCEWHCHRAKSVERRECFQLARDITLAEDLSLDYVFNFVDANFYTERGVTMGIAWSWIDRVKEFLEEHTPVDNEDSIFIE